MQLRLLQKASDLKVPVLLFLGRDGGKKLAWIKPVLEKLPDLLVVIDHMVRCPAVRTCTEPSSCGAVTIFSRPRTRENPTREEMRRAIAG